MEWNYIYLIPLIMAIISAIIWVIVFFINYKNTKSISAAVSAATEAMNNFKGVTTSMVKIRDKDGNITIIEEETATEETATEETATEETATEETATEDAIALTATQRELTGEEIEKFFAWLYEKYKNEKE